jgi:hypothetical protein
MVPWNTPTPTHPREMPSTASQLHDGTRKDGGNPVHMQNLGIQHPEREVVHKINLANRLKVAYIPPVQRSIL